MRLNNIIAVLSLVVLGQGCHKDTDQKDINESIMVSVDAAGQVLADGQRLMPVHYQLTNARSTDYFTPAFPAEGGTQTGLVSGKVYLVNNEATSYIKTSIIPGTYTLSVQLNDLGSTLRQFSITTSPSLPDTLLVEADKSLADTIPGSVVNFTVFLRKNSGKVSKGTSISARAFQVRPGPDSVDVGRFVGLINNKSDDDGKLTFQLFTDTRNFDNSKIVQLLVWSGTNNNTVTKTKYLLPIK